MLAAAAKKAWAQAHPEKVRQSHNKWRKAHPESGRAYTRKWIREHPEQAAMATALWRENNKEYIQEYERAYRKKNAEAILLKNARRRALKANAPINDLTLKEWKKIKDHYGYKCVYCGRKMKRLTQDHIIPLSKGGPHTASNVVPACLSCNSRKGQGGPLVPVQPILCI
jgi:5-methylcytosine-specific restriction endonuclease McrA